MATSKLQALWNHPAGPKTIHFWAPTFKWGISIANIADFAKPPDKLSYPQQIAVTATGVIWSRYSTVITPSSITDLRMFFPLKTGIFLASTLQWQGQASTSFQGKSSKLVQNPGSKGTSALQPFQSMYSFALSGHDYFSKEEAVVAKE
ncbi:unnamed protein product [Camellia sinensis]